MSKKHYSQSLPEIPRQRLRERIDFFDETMVLSRFAEGGKAVSRRIVQAEDLIRLFAGMRAAETKWISLSPEILRIGMDSGGAWRVLLVRKAGWVTIRCRVGKTARRIRVKLPNLLAELSANAEKGPPRWKQVEAVYGFKGRLGPKTKLFVPPLPNLHSDGSICMGNVKMGRAASLPAGKAFEAVFLRSEFSDHLAGSPLKDKAPWGNILEALRKMRGRVPVKWLEPITTFEKLWKGQTE